MLQGKSAIVTGSTSGIGLTIAHALAQAGCNVMLNGLGDAATIEATRADIARDTSVKVAYSPADMSSPEAVRAMVSAAVLNFGSVDILINNAGIQHVQPIDQFDEMRWDLILAINLSSAFHASKAVIPLMRKAGWGRIINVASAHGLVASPFKSAYVAAKHGVVGLTRQMAVAYGARGITVNCVCPGAIPTGLRPHSQSILGPNVPDMSNRGVAVNDDQIRALIPAGVRGTVEDIAQAVCYLASDEAGYVNGHAMVVDGGWRAK